MSSQEFEVEDERGMGWPHWDGQSGDHPPEHDPTGAGPIKAVSDEEEAA